MKRVFLIVSAAAMLAVGLSVTAFAGGNSGISACETEFGATPDQCATCLNPSSMDGETGAGSTAACLCKLAIYQDPGSFPSQGACLVYAHSIGYN